MPVITAKTTGAVLEATLLSCRQVRRERREREEGSVTRKELEEDRNALHSSSFVDVVVSLALEVVFATTSSF
jgi:hypothetical protein